ncbi:hypothetical protein GOP47_0001885 [Adiantum capillus-veneris]|uniref:Flavin-containing monooxygenase n=1 Tax=Adiantum capillus-veneris TaxID=13818 RepID=A0A9D4V9N6_ADICA|nr:hypothetical protein GOP47_0001885 [Adiantum capillus-veneris]
MRTALFRMAPSGAVAVGAASQAPKISSKLPQRRKLSVAVIGAGAGGLTATRELLKEGHQVVVFEQDSYGVGGVWRYLPQTEAEDPLGISPDCTRIHSSMYLSLRTNLPREIMGFLDFPFLPKYGDECRDARRYPDHAEVLAYLQDYALHFNLLPYVRFGRRVTQVAPIHKPTVHPESLAHPLPSKSEFRLPHQWSVTSEAEAGRMTMTDIFDAVVICNGHYFQPKLPLIPGIEKWPGTQLHSHNYRVPQPFADQIVVVIGNSSSGSDISREIATVAKEVHLVGRTWDSGVDLKKPAGPSQNIFLHPMVKLAQANGELLFEGGDTVVANAILYCTGYAFSMPFLETVGVINVDSDFVGRLYQHIFPPQLAPTLSFVGLPFKVIPFPLMQLQSKWIAKALSGKVLLPSTEQMSEDVEEFYKNLEAKGIPKSKVHDLGSCQFEYDNWLADQCGCQAIEDWRIQIYINSSKRKRALPDSYRDEWTDQELHELAIADLNQLQIA